MASLLHAYRHLPTLPDTCKHLTPSSSKACDTCEHHVTLTFWFVHLHATVTSCVDCCKAKSEIAIVTSCVSTANAQKQRLCKRVITVVRPANAPTWHPLYGEEEGLPCWNVKATANQGGSSVVRMAFKKDYQS